MNDDYTHLARCMGCEPNEVPRLIQQHAPWNGKSACDDALRERAAVVAWLHAEAQRMYEAGQDRPAWFVLESRADAIERGEHRREEEP